MNHSYSGRQTISKAIIIQIQESKLTMLFQQILFRVQVKIFQLQQYYIIQIMAQGQEGAAKVAMGVAIGCMIFFLLPFMICDFIFAGGDSKCLTQEITKYAITINLKQWLLTDAWVALVLIILLLVVLVITCVNIVAGMAMFACVACLTLLIGLYKIAWLIIGSIMFWGELQPAGTCNQSLNDYMWVKLILGLVGVICNCVSSSGGGAGRTE